MASAQFSKPPLENGQSIHTMLGETITVRDLIGQGGQGSVFNVDYAGKQKALKWYRKGVFISEGDFKDNLRKNIEDGSPAPEFIWPEDMTDDFDGSFGYVMDLRPKGYYEATEYLLHNVTFQSFRRTVDACLNVVAAFDLLHSKGKNYKDINGGNFFFEPKTGRALICDNDNVGSSAYQTGVIGTPRFMAPEIVRRESMPNTYTDRHSMGVLLFLLLCMGHPLEGKRSLLPVLDAQHQRALYGTDPIFMMDPRNHDNEPDPVIHAGSISVWGCLPQYLRDIFVWAFSHEVLMDHPERRPTEEDWLEVLTRFRSDIIPCHCGNEVFTEDGKPALCDKCGSRVRSSCRLQLPDYAIPLVYDSRLYKCQTGPCNKGEALDPVARVAVAGSGQQRTLVLQNVSKEAWRATTSKGEPRLVKPGQVIPVKPGISFVVGASGPTPQTARILSNQ